jgi:thioredoxin reductase
MIEWLIIGGGIHGTYLSHLLVHQAGVSRDDVRVLDPHQKPLAAWTKFTANCGMNYLRSPATHNIDIPILSLYRYVKSFRGNSVDPFIPPYNRPSLTLFNTHCDHIVRHNRLENLRIVGRALALEKKGRLITAETTTGRIKSRYVILAIGMGEQPYWPTWARSLQKDGARIDHLFDIGFRPAKTSESSMTVVVGGGISAVQASLKLSNRLPGKIRLISRHRLRKSQYDFDPCWIGPKCLKEFHCSDYGKRRHSVDRARIGGSAPFEVLEELRNAVSAGRIEFQQGCIRGASTNGGRIRLKTETDAEKADAVVLATGFHPERPGGPFIDQVIKNFGLKIGSCGYPIVGHDLRWSENIFLTGPLAELQLGPCARNIVGARNAGRHLLNILPSL